MNKTTARNFPICAFFVLAVLLLLGLIGQSRSAPAQGAIDPIRATVADASSPHPLESANAPVATANLPDAPAPAHQVADALPEESTSSQPDLDFMNPATVPAGLGISPDLPGRVPLNQCPFDTTRARECRVHWRHLIITASAFNAFQDSANLYTSYWYRYETTTGKWFDRWFNSVLGWRWDQWNDGNPFLDDWVAHPMMGGITNSMWIQDDPRGATLEFGNNRQYWHSRLRALAFSTAYSFQWKFGPFGEAGVGHNGDHGTDFVNGKLQNDTGVVELVSTPLGGLGWTIGEDYLDKHLVRKLEQKPRGTAALLAISFLTSARSTANIFRFRPPWYRDGREVRSTNFFSEPPGPEDGVAAQELSSNAETSATAATLGPSSGEVGFAATNRKSDALPVWPHYGGVHEFGAWWGLSLNSGHVFGYDKNVKYMPIDLFYSYLIYRGAKWNLRYTPEITALALMDEPLTGKTDSVIGPVPTDPQKLRKRTYGSGLSPMGFRTSFYPEKRLQPFFSTNGGILYFADQVLSPQASQLMFTVDLGAGLTFYHHRRQAVSFGYRYQHLSNANISVRNPGTDADTFYVQISRFRTRGYR
jgi:hypothetical protein